MSWKAFQSWFDMIWFNYVLYTVHPLLVVPLPTCLLYFTILAHKPSVRPSIVRFLIRRWVFVHGPLIERHLVQDCHIVKMAMEFRVFWQRTVMICVYLWAFHPIFRFSFWLTKLPKTKIGCMIFCTMFSVCKARHVRWKWKMIKKTYYVIFRFLYLLSTKMKKWKMGWKAH